MINNKTELTEKLKDERGQFNQIVNKYYGFIEDDVERIDVIFNPEKFTNELWLFIETAISQTKQELIGEIEKLKNKDCGWTGYGVLAKHMGTYEQIQASKDYAYKKGIDDVLEVLSHNRKP